MAFIARNSFECAQCIKYERRCECDGRTIHIYKYLRAQVHHMCGARFGSPQLMPEYFQPQQITFLTTYINVLANTHSTAFCLRFVDQRPLPNTAQSHKWSSFRLTCLTGSAGLAYPYNICTHHILQLNILNNHTFSFSFLLVLNLINNV